jgi:hypothetical protein
MNDSCNHNDLTHRFANRRMRCVHNRFAGDFNFSRERGASRHRRNIVLEQALLQELHEYFRPNGTPAKGEKNEDYAGFTWHGVQMNELHRYDARHLAQLDDEELEMERHYGGSRVDLRDGDGNVTQLAFDRNGRIRSSTTDEPFDAYDRWSDRGFDDYGYDDYGYDDRDYDDIDWRLAQRDEGLDDGPDDDEESEEESFFESESRRFDHSIVYTHDNWY